MRLLDRELHRKLKLFISVKSFLINGFKVVLALSANIGNARSDFNLIKFYQCLLSIYYVQERGLVGLWTIISISSLVNEV